MSRRLLTLAAVAGSCSLVAVLAAGPVQGRSQPTRPTAARALFGHLSLPFGRTSESVARRYLASRVGLLGLRHGTRDLALSREFRSPMGSHYLFHQRFRGVPVYGAETAVHFNRSGQVVAVTNDYVPTARIDSVRPAVARASALRRLRARLGSGRAHAGLVVYRFGGVWHLAWHVTLARTSHTWETFIEARSGAILGSPKDINRYVNGTGRVFRDNAVVATGNAGLRDQNDAASAVPNTAYSTVTLQGLAGNGFLDGTFASSARTKKRAKNAGNSFVFDRSNDGFSETMGYYYIDYAQRYIQSLGFTNVDNRQQAFTVNRSKQDNSFYSPSTKDITYGTGGVDDAEDAEVILHEYGHSIQDDQRPGFGSGLEAGAMGEGFGDYWAGTVTAQLSGGFQDECIADWDATSYSPDNPPCLRRLDTAKHYPESVVGEVHQDGEIWSGALWQIRGAIGPTKADKVILQHHFLLPANASFNTAANALVTAAVNLGYTNAEVDSIRSILQARGFIVTA